MTSAADRFRGGLGLTGGISDVGGLFDCLYGIYEGKADLQILDEYDRLRRKIFWTVANPISTLNLERIRKDPAELVGSEDVLFKQLEEAKTDPSIFSELKKVSALFPLVLHACFS